MILAESPKDEITQDTAPETAAAPGAPESGLKFKGPPIPLRYRRGARIQNAWRKWTGSETELDLSTVNKAVNALECEDPLDEFERILPHASLPRDTALARNTF